MGKYAPGLYMSLKTEHTRYIQILLYRRFDSAFTMEATVEGAHQASRLCTHEIHQLISYHRLAMPLTRLTYAGIFAAEMAAITDSRAFLQGSPEIQAELFPRLSQYAEMLELAEGVSV